MIDKSKRKIISETYEASVIRDEYGNESRPLGVRKIEYVGPNDEIITEKIMENTVLEDGRVWNSSLALRSGKDAVFVSRCPCCNKDKDSMHLTLARGMRRCYKCGRFVCSKCIRISRDGHLRCRKCNRNYGLLRFLTWVFFEEED